MSVCAYVTEGMYLLLVTLKKPFHYKLITCENSSVTLLPYKCEVSKITCKTKAGVVLRACHLGSE